MNSPVSAELAELDHELITRWDRLFEESLTSNPFASREWFDFWYHSYQPTGKPVVVKSMIGNEVSGLAVFVRRGRHLCSLGDPELADYSDFLAVGDAATSMYAIMEKLVEISADRIIIDKIRGDSSNRPGLEGWLQHSVRPWRRRTVCGNPRVVLQGDFKSYYTTRRKSLRQELRTTESHLGRMGDWSFYASESTVDMLPIMQALERFHLQRQHGKAGHSIFSNPRHRDFLFRLVDHPPSTYKIQMSGLRLAGRWISAAMSIRCRDTLFYWIPSFDASIPSVSLGKFHIKCLIESSFADRSLRYFDFMGGDEGYKLQWSNDMIDVYRYDVFPTTVEALTSDLLLSLRRLAKTAKDRYSLGTVWVRLSKATRQ